MGSKPIRAVPVQAYNVRGVNDNDNNGNELVHSQSDGIVCTSLLLLYIYYFLSF